MTQPPKPKRPPLILPEQSPPGSQDDTQPRKKKRVYVINRRRRGFIVAMWMTLMLLAFTLATVTTVVVNRPEVIGLAQEIDLTRTASVIDRTAIALDTTAESLRGQGFANDSTAAALDNRQAVLVQQETQSSRDISATGTAIAFDNARQATSAALDFRATQSAFEAQATRVELDYRGTQAALAQEATTVALGFATNAPSAPNPLSLTPSATLTQRPLLEDGFASGVNGGLWRLGDAADWALDGGTLTARRSGAWLLTQLTSLTEYTFELTILPLAGAEFAADYFVLVNVPAGSPGVALRLSYNGSRLNAAGLYAFTVPQLLDADGLLNERLDTIQAVQVDVSASESLAVRVEVRDDRLIAVTNGAIILDVVLDAPLLPGSVGLQLPENAGIERAVLSP